MGDSTEKGKGSESDPTKGSKSDKVESRLHYEAYDVKVNDTLWSVASSTLKQEGVHKPSDPQIDIETGKIYQASSSMKRIATEELESAGTLHPTKAEISAAENNLPMYEASDIRFMDVGSGDQSIQTGQQLEIPILDFQNSKNSRDTK